MEIHEGSLLLGVLIGAAVGCLLTFVLGVLAETWEDRQWTATPPVSCPAPWLSTSVDGKHWTDPVPYADGGLTREERKAEEVLERARLAAGRATL